MTTTTTQEQETKFTRWEVRVWYLTELGPDPIDVIYHIEELNELQDIMERGPSWQALDRIEITYRGLREKLTMEEALKL